MLAPAGKVNVTPSLIRQPARLTALPERLRSSSHSSSESPVMGLKYNSLITTGPRAATAFAVPGVALTRRRTGPSPSGVRPLAVSGNCPRKRTASSTRVSAAFEK